MSNDCKVKTRYFWMIHKELEKAIEKHPKFCDAIIDPDSRVSWAESEFRTKDRNMFTKDKYADNVLLEEMAEAFAAYQAGDKEHALQELAQCGAVILRIMEKIDINAKT